MQQVRITIPFFLWFFKYRKPLKRIATLTSRKTIENSSHNKKLLDQQIKNQEESSKESKETKFNQEFNENSKEESSETKFNQILFFSTPREVEETLSTTKIEKPKEINETSKVENQLKNSSHFVPEISLFEEESESKNFSHDNPPLNINIIRKIYIKINHFVFKVELIKTN